MEIFSGLRLSPQAQGPVGEIATHNLLTADTPIDRQAVIAYTMLCERFPTLRQVELVLDLKDMTREDREYLEEFPITPALCLAPSNDKPYFSVLLNPHFTKEMYIQELDEFPKTQALFAESIGIPVDFYRTHPRIALFQALFHEFGHAWHYLARYRHTDLTAQEITVAIDNMREWEMNSLPVPGFAPSQLQTLDEVDGNFLEEQLAFNKEAYVRMGITTREELKDRQESAYRTLPSEQEADRFSAYALHLFWDYLGLPEIPKENQP